MNHFKGKQFQQDVIIVAYPSSLKLIGIGKYFQSLFHCLNIERLFLLDTFSLSSE